MGAARNVAGFAGLLALAFGGALALGGTVGGDQVDSVTVADDATADPAAGTGHSAGHGATGHGADGHVDPATELGGLSGTVDGYSLAVRTTTLAPDEPFVFAVVGADGAPVTEYVEEHTKDLHLIAVEADGPGYRHVHPSRDADGRWTGDVDLTPGAWRLYADTVPAGDAARRIVLGVDVEVTGALAGPAGPAAPGPAVDGSTGTAVVGDLTVELDGAPVAGQPVDLAFAVTRAGTPVVTEPYLGALGHLVVVRESDLAYLHVHPDTDALTFAATFPTAGSYRLFLDIQVEGTVRTAPFTVEVTG